MVHSSNPGGDCDMLSSAGIPLQLLGQLRKSFRAEPTNIVAMNAICRAEMNTVLMQRDLALDTYHVYSDRLEQEARATNQKSTGRCWIFAALNVLRLPLMKRYKLEDFEFSQAYLFWCDKLEKSNWFLNNVLSTLDEELDGRLVQFLLADPVQDGGQWDMVVNLIQKYGLMPKSVYPESVHSSNSRQLNWLLTAKLREYACQLREAHKRKEGMEALNEMKEKMLSQIYNILSITLGEPPVTFSWNFRDKDKKFTGIPSLTPQIFYKEHVQTEIGNYISLIHDPRHDYYRLYTVQFLGNVVGGRPTLYVNVPLEELKRYAIASIQSGNSVWFGCDVGKFSNRQAGIMDMNLYDYRSGYNLRFDLNKADRLRYGESKMTHAMVLTAVHLEENKPVRWRVENSWGEDGGEKGYFSMADNWFSEYVYQLVVDKNALSEEAAKVLDQEPIVLPPWEQNFARLFRHSQFARFDPVIPRIYHASPLPPPSTLTGAAAEQGTQGDRPPFFGFKKDLPLQHYERPLQHVQMRKLDADYGQCELRNGGDRYRAYMVVSELQRLLGTAPMVQDGKTEETQVPQVFCSESVRGGTGGLQVPGRVLNRLSQGGYAIGIGGVVAELPSSEVPMLMHFSNSDIMNRRAFWFWVKKAEIDASGIARIVVSLKKTDG